MKTKQIAIVVLTIVLLMPLASLAEGSSKKGKDKSLTSHAFEIDVRFVPPIK